MEEIIKARNKLLRALQKVVSQPQYDNFREIYHQIRNDEERMLAQSCEEIKKVSYSRKPEYRLDSKRRIRTTLGRFISKNYRHFYNFDDKQLNDFVSNVIAHTIDTEEVFSLIRGPDIEVAYRDGVGGYTCMSEERSPLTRFYSENPDKVGMLVLNEKEARALVWKSDEDIILMDRIYPNDGQHIPLYNKYAKEQKWVIRKHNSAPLLQCDDFSKKEFDDYHKITLKQSSTGKYPYMDSWMYAKKLPNNLVLVTNSPKDYDTTLLRTSGYFEDGCITCYKCGIRTGEFYEVNENNYCRCCVVRCAFCRIYMLREESKDSGYHGMVCSECYDRAIECPKCNNKILPTMLRNTEKGKMCIRCEDNLYCYCSRCDKRMLREEAKSNSLYDYLCEECYNR